MVDVRDDRDVADIHYEFGFRGRKGLCLRGYIRMGCDTGKAR
jgi:hypothetical protein